MSPGNIVSLQDAGLLKDLSGTLGKATGIWWGEAVIEKYGASEKDKIIAALNSEFDKNKRLSKQCLGSWECFDRAYWAISAARCQFPGIPIGVATGTFTASGKQQEHAIVYFWYWNGKNFLPVKYDAQGLDVSDFQPTFFAGFPIYRPNYDPENEHKLKGKMFLPPFDNKELTEIDSGWTMLYETEGGGGYDVSNFEAIKGDLENLRKGTNPKWHQICPKPKEGTNELEIFKKRTREDRVFWIYNQIRFAYPRSAVGFAWGAKTKAIDKHFKDDAVIVLWKSAGDFKFWDVKDGIIGQGDFKVKFVLG